MSLFNQVFYASPALKQRQSILQEQAKEKEPELELTDAGEN